ncbi:hypothetical protein EII32_11420 [Prevotella sp. OH937_COT-195]|nr:hypothetical protein EII32_11420 [Prevotella sp. OH937_COT-195]
MVNILYKERIIVAITIIAAGIQKRKSIVGTLKRSANKIMPIACSGSIFFTFSSIKIIPQNEILFE